MSIRTRLAYGVLLPLGLAVTSLGLVWIPIATGSTHLQATALLSGALMFMAIGLGLVMLERNAQALTQPLEEACAAANALLQGDHGRSIRITRMDETSDVLVALHELGNYLAVMLPEEHEDEDAPGRHLSASASAAPEAMDRIVKRLREGEEEYGPVASSPAPQPPVRPAQRPRLVSSNQA